MGIHPTGNAMLLRRCEGRLEDTGEPFEILICVVDGMRFTDVSVREKHGRKPFLGITLLLKKLVDGQAFQVRHACVRHGAQKLF